MKNKIGINNDARESMEITADLQEAISERIEVMTKGTAIDFDEFLKKEGICINVSH